MVGLNFAFASGSVHAQFLNSEASLGSECQYTQAVDDTGCLQLQYSVLSARKQETLALTSNGRNVAGVPNGIEQSIDTLNDNRITMADNMFTFHFNNSVRYFNQNTFATNQIDGVFRMAGYVPRFLQDTPVFISLTLLDCPLGFALSADPHKCECDRRIQEHNLTCDITSQTVHREGTIWINVSFSGNSSNGVIVHEHCPFGYCKQEAVDVDLTNPDT